MYRSLPDTRLYDARNRLSWFVVMANFGGGAYRASGPPSGTPGVRFGPVVGRALLDWRVGVTGPEATAAVAESSRVAASTAPPAVRRDSIGVSSLSVRSVVGEGEAA